LRLGEFALHFRGFSDVNFLKIASTEVEMGQLWGIISKRRDARGQFQNGFV